MRAVTVVLVAATGCGRIGFDAIATGDDAGTADAPAPPQLACGDTISPGGGPIAGSALEAVATARGLAALWIDAAGALLGTTWAAAPGGVAVVQDSVVVERGPFTQLRVAANDDQVLVATQDASGLTVRLLRGDLAVIRPGSSLGTGAFAGRDPFTRKRGGSGFVAITQAGDQPGVFEIPPPASPVAYLLTDLKFHAAPSIAADSDGYAVVTEYSDQYGPGCWYSRISDSFGFVSGPGTVESTQQADCDSSTVSPSAGPAGAALAWMDRDPVNSYVEFRGTGAGGGVASLSGETGVGAPLVAATSTGFAVLYRATAGVRVFDGSGARTLAPSGTLADLVTWADDSIVVWATTSGQPRLTRLCPAAAGP